MKYNNLCQKRTLKNGVSLIFASQKNWCSLPNYEGNYKNKAELKSVSECRKFSYYYGLRFPNTRTVVTILRAGSHYGQTLRGEAFGPMKMQKCPKFVLSAFR